MELFVIYSFYLESPMVFINEEAAVLLVKNGVKEINTHANLITKLIFFENYVRSLKVLENIIIIINSCNHIIINFILVCGYAVPDIISY